MLQIKSSIAKYLHHDFYQKDNQSDIQQNKEAQFKYERLIEYFVTKKQEDCCENGEYSNMDEVQIEENLPLCQQSYFLPCSYDLCYDVSCLT